MSQTGKSGGRDNIMTYSGSSEINGRRFTASVSIKRHTEGHATVFCADDLTLRLEGTCPGKIACYVRTAEDRPAAPINRYGRPKRRRFGGSVWPMSLPTWRTFAPIAALNARAFCCLWSEGQ